MSTIADSDYFIINRGSTSYKISAEDVKSELGGGQYDGVGRFDTPVQVLTPVNGAGLTTSATYQPFTAPSLRDTTPNNIYEFKADFGPTPVPAGLVAPVTQCGPDGEIYYPQLGAIKSISRTDYTSKFKYTGVVKGGAVNQMFTGYTQPGGYLLLGPNSEFDFTDCHLPTSYNDHVMWYASSNFDPDSTKCLAIYEDGSVDELSIVMNAANQDISLRFGTRLLKIQIVGGNGGTEFGIIGFRVDASSNSLGEVGPNIIKDTDWQLFFEPNTLDIKYMKYGMAMAPHNKQIAYGCPSNDSVVLFFKGVVGDTIPDQPYSVGDVCTGPPLNASATEFNSRGNNIYSISSMTGNWYPGLCVKGAPITASAPSPGSVEFTSMNFNTTEVTGTNVSLTNRRWSLESSSSESGPWSVVGSYDDDSANFSQNGSDKWIGKPTLQANTYYRVKVRYDSSNAPSEESVQTIFKTA